MIEPQKRPRPLFSGRAGSTSAAKVGTVKVPASAGGHFCVGGIYFFFPHKTPPVTLRGGAFSMMVFCVGGDILLRGGAWPTEGWRPTARGGIFARGNILPPGVVAFCAGGYFCSKGISAVTLRGGAFSIVMFCAGGHFSPGDFRGDFAWAPTHAGTFTDLVRILRLRPTGVSRGGEEREK